MVSSEYWFGASAGFYNGIATQSLRLDGGSQITLDNAGSATSNKKATISVWFKRADEITSLAYLFHSKNDGSFGDGSNGLASFSITLDADDNISVVQYNGNPSFNANQYDFGVKTSGKLFRDMGSWYHLVVAIDTTQGSGTTNEADRIKMYVNGEQQTVVAITDGSGYQDFADENQLVAVNQDGEQRWGGTVDDGTYAHVYLAETNVVDGLQLDASYFGEFKSGVWIAKTPNVSEYGNHGYRLEFKGTGTATSSGAVSSPTNIGDDSSGKNNHFTSTNVSAHDCAMPDSPENNFPVMDILSFALTADNIAEGGLRVGQTDQFVHASAFAFPTSGKWYWEVYSKSSNGSNYYMPYAGVCNSTFFNNEQDVGGSAGDTLHNTAGFSHIRGNDAKYKNLTGTSTQNGANTSTEGQAGTEQGIVGFALDVDAGTIKYYWNNSLVRTDSTLTAGDEFFAFTVGTNSGSNIWNYNYFNFGQDSTFAGNLSAGGNEDANNVGDFAYAPPSSHLALCSANLPEPTISPNSDTKSTNHFGTLTYSGNGNSVSIVSGGNDNNGNAVGGEIDFKPDWLWTKDTNGNENHILMDSSRGNTHRLSTNSSANETTDSNVALTSFDTNGFTLTQYHDSNLNNSTNIAWCWLANGTTPSRTYKVVVVSDSGNKFRFRNSADNATFAQSAVTLNLQELGTYTFDVSDSSMSGHALKFSTTSDGIHGGGSEYTTGVTSSGTSGQSGAYVQITVASSAPTLYYYCGISGHSGMGGQINTNTTHGSTNFDGSVLSITNVNETAGFSIVTYSGNTDASATIGHGLSSTPELIFIKQRDETGEWVGFNKISGATKKLNLSQNLAEATSALFNNTAPTTSAPLVFSVKDTSTEDTFGDSHTYVAYCFHSVEGYSKIDSFTGNGSTDGTFIFTGFRPQFILAKSTASGSWHLVDEELDVNPVGYLNAETADDYQDYAHYDILSNGFKVRDNGSHTNPLNTKVVYLAFAKQPYKFANAR